MGSGVGVARDRDHRQPGCLYVHRPQNLAEARQISGELIARYEEEWIIGCWSRRLTNPARAWFGKQAARIGMEIVS